MSFYYLRTLFYSLYLSLKLLEVLGFDISILAFFLYLFICFYLLPIFLFFLPNK